MFGYPYSLLVTVGCDGRVYNISNGPVVLTVNTTFGGVVTGPYNNLQFVNITGLPSNWSVGSQTCIPTIDGNGQGFVTGFACNNFTITSFTNETTIVNVPHETTVMINGSVITIGTVQPIDVTSTPTFAGITITNSGGYKGAGFQVLGGGEFDGNGGSSAWIPSQVVGATGYTAGFYPSITPLIISGLPTTGSYFPTANENVPTIVFSPGTARTTLTLSSLGAGNSYISWDMVQGVVQTGSLTYGPAWVTTTTGVVGYAFYSVGNELILDVGTPGSVDQAVSALTTPFIASPSGIAMTGVTASSLTVTGSTLIDTNLVVEGTTTLDGNVGMGANLAVDFDATVYGTLTLPALTANRFVTTGVGGVLTASTLAYNRWGPIYFSPCVNGACFDWYMNITQIASSFTYQFYTSEGSFTADSGFQGYLQGTFTTMPTGACWSIAASNIISGGSAGMAAGYWTAYALQFTCSGTSTTWTFNLGPTGGVSEGTAYIFPAITPITAIQT
jgi:hypothetical protein